MIERPLDLDSVRAFVRIAELDSFTRAAGRPRDALAALSVAFRSAVRG